MASEALFKYSPPFPDDLAVASIPRVSLAKLLSTSSSGHGERGRLTTACKELGFFLLDLHGDDSPLGTTLTANVDTLIRAMEPLFQLPLEEKKQYTPAVLPSGGYKSEGTARVDGGNLDRFEWWTVEQDGLLGTKPLQPIPAILQTHREALLSHLQASQAIIHLVSTILAEELGLASDVFTSRQTASQTSNTVVRFTHVRGSREAEDKGATLPSHTDIGTVTVLANVVGGLQVLMPAEREEDREWAFVRPEPRCLIVNLGDAMTKWSGGVLRSNIHRVTYSPGEQGYVDRYSLAVLGRPSHDASMRSIMGGQESDEIDVTAREWESQRIQDIRAGRGVLKAPAAVSVK